MTLGRLSLLLLALIAVSGCSTLGGRDASSTSKKGGYYLDDGPGDNPPANLDAIPDAVPKAEPLARGANKPYSALGKSYVPMPDGQPYKASGLASWYGRRYHGKPTSTGEPYDMYAMSAAHTTLPLPSYVRVTNVQNGRSVVVRVNDRGPFVDDRLIDLSYTAAYKLGILRGVTPVEVERVFPEDTKPEVVQVVRLDPPLIEEVKPLESLNLPPPPEKPKAKPLARKPVEAKPSEMKQAEIKPAESAQVEAGSYLQVGAFAVQQTADDLVARIANRLGALAQGAHSVQIGGLFKVRVGPFRDAAAMDKASALIQDIFGIRPFKVEIGRGDGIKG